MSDFDPYYKWLGISKEEQPVSHYRLLGLREGETNLGVIENAIDRQVAFLQQQSVGNHGSHAKKLLDEVNKAKLILLNPEVKTAYDRGLQLTEPEMESSAPKPVVSGASYSVSGGKTPALDAAEQSASSIPVVTTGRSGSVASGARRGRSGVSRKQWAKENFHWVVAGSGGLVVALIFLIILLSNVLSSPDRPALADGSTNKPPSSNPTTSPSSSNLNTSSTKPTSNENDNSNSTIDTNKVTPISDKPGDDADANTSDKSDENISEDTGDSTSPEHTVSTASDRDIPTSHSPTVTPVVNNISPGSTTTVVKPRVVYPPVLGFDRSVPGGPVAYWPITKSDSSKVVDQAGTQDGTLMGNAKIVSDGGRDAVLKLDGESGYIKLGDPLQLDIQGEITISAWVRTEATNEERNIVVRGHTMYPKGEICLRIQDGEFQIGSWNGFDYQAAVKVLPEEIGQWVHLAGVYDGKYWRLYKNGVEVAASLEPTGAVPVKAGWAIGARENGIDRFFKGSLDEIRIFNRAVSAEEAAALARAPLNGKP